MFGVYHPDAGGVGAQMAAKIKLKKWESARHLKAEADIAR